MPAAHGPPQPAWVCRGALHRGRSVQPRTLPLPSPAPSLGAGRQNRRLRIGRCPLGRGGAQLCHLGAGRPSAVPPLCGSAPVCAAPRWARSGLGRAQSVTLWSRQLPPSRRSWACVTPRTSAGRCFWGPSHRRGGWGSLGRGGRLAPGLAGSLARLGSVEGLRVQHPAGRAHVVGSFPEGSPARRPKHGAPSWAGARSGRRLPDTHQGFLRPGLQHILVPRWVVPGHAVPSPRRAGSEGGVGPPLQLVFLWSLGGKTHQSTMSKNSPRTVGTVWAGGIGRPPRVGHSWPSGGPGAARSWLPARQPPGPSFLRCLSRVPSLPGPTGALRGTPAGLGTGWPPDFRWKAVLWAGVLSPSRGFRPGTSVHWAGLTEKTVLGPP